LPVDVRGTHSVAEQSAGQGKFSELIDGG
jgi:hypothetical protein